MPIISKPFRYEARDRYLTYALSVVSDRALPDVRDGLKPVQRRILYDMLKNLNLKPTSSFKKSAAIVGGVLARFHPHGDIACYEAMVRMAQDFSLRYPLVEGQGNFGSLDGDSAAAYRYTEARLRQLAIEVIGEIDQETVAFRDTFDATRQEPIVLPSRVPNLLINGVTGIAVGMATSIPPHNLKDTVGCLIELLDNPTAKISRLVTVLKGPDFPTGCDVLNNKKELDEIYETGQGAIRMRGSWKTEKAVRNKLPVVINSIPFAVNKAHLVEKIADLIIDKKLPQVHDIRDESTEDIRIVVEVNADADLDNVMAYICKHTNLECNFNVNLTALTPSANNATVPQRLDLKTILQQFIDFRIEVIRRRLEFEKKNLLERLHILEGFMKIFDFIDEVIKIVRKSDGRSDSAQKLQKKFKLSELQSFAIVDLKIYQLSKTNIDEIKLEFKNKEKRVQEIDRLLKSKKKIIDLLKKELQEIVRDFGDTRRSQVMKNHVDVEIEESAFVVKEDVFALVSAEGWIKRIRQSNDPATTRSREGDSWLAVHPANTLDEVFFFTSHGNVYSLNVTDFPASSGYGDPIQKHLKFKDGEVIAASYLCESEDELGHDEEYLQALFPNEEIVIVSKQGMGFQAYAENFQGLKKSGRRILKLKNNDALQTVIPADKKVSFITKAGYALTLLKKDILERKIPAVGVNLMSVRKDDEIIAVIPWDKPAEITLELTNDKTKKINLKDIKQGKRALKGNKLPVRSQLKGVIHG